jgi:signal transduction histidine kinase
MSLARVIIVEDERIVALNIRQRLTKLGYDVPAVATSGLAALAAIERERPDVVLMDINIEGPIDGIETTSRIPDSISVAVIYLTAYSEEATLERARATKPFGYLLKPFSERELHATIQMALQRRNADDLVRQNEARLKFLVEERTAELEAANSELKVQIKERLKAEEALHQSQKMEAIGQLTGGIAHDFNNLLQGISGALELVRRRLEQGRIDEVTQFIEGAIGSSARASALTNRLLAFARRTPLAPQALSCADLISGMEDLLRRTAGEAVRLELGHAADLWPTLCDGNQLESAILNLVINSRDAMPAGGLLTIRTSNVELDVVTESENGVSAGQYVCIAVTDTGSGMSPETVARAFDPFFTTKPIGEGTGLGLSMVYGFARQSMGYARIESELGRGTTVKLYLPRLAAELRADDPRTSPAGESHRSDVVHDGEVVLVVEDDAVVRSIVVDILRELGCETLEAADGLAGLDILRTAQRLDLLVADLGLPGLNGRQVADAGRQLRPNLKILFITAYAESATSAEGFLDGGMQLIRKPFALDALTGCIREMLEPAPPPVRLPSGA